MRDRMAGQEIWDRMGITPDEMARDRRARPARARTSSRCSSRRSCRTARSSGLLDAADGWLRTKFTEMGVIAFEDFEDTTLEIDQAADGSPASADDL